MFHRRHQDLGLFGLRHIEVDSASQHLLMSPCQSTFWVSLKRFGLDRKHHHRHTLVADLCVIRLALLNRTPGVRERNSSPPSPHAFCCVSLLLSSSATLLRERHPDRHPDRRRRDVFTEWSGCDAAVIGPFASLALNRRGPSDFPAALALWNAEWHGPELRAVIHMMDLCGSSCVLTDVLFCF